MPIFHAYNVLVDHHMERLAEWTKATVLKSVAEVAISPHQPLYVPQSCLQCTNAFHQTAGDAKPLVDVLVDG